MLWVVLSLVHIAQFCACLRILAPTIVTVGITATATWSQDGVPNGVNRIELVQDQPESQFTQDLANGDIGSSPTGLVSFIVQEAGRYRVVGVADGFSTQGSSRDITAVEKPQGQSTSDSSPISTTSSSTAVPTSQPDR
ncbi:hypothetical protein PQX77_021588, partial [Marasmius sp. AFHP31]